MKTRFAVAAAMVAAGMVLAGTAAFSAAQAINAADKKFATEAATGGMMEVTLGQYASEHASNAAVKEFGQRMVRDHSKANDELMKLASTLGVELPKKLDAKHQAMVDKMTKLSGSQFDQAYMKDMVEDHVKDVREFEMQAKNGQNTQLTTWAKNTLPTLREHLKMARDVAKQVGASAAGAR